MVTSSDCSTWKEPRNLRKVPALFLTVDPSIVVGAQQGDAIALDQLLDELAPYVRWLCASVAPELVDDATQEALTAIFRNLRRLRAPEAILSCARVITVRAAMEAAREADRDQVVGDVAERRDDRARPEELVDVADALRRIPRELRVVLVLRQIEGMSEREVAHALKVPVGTVKSRLHRARVTFREVWSR